MTSDRPYYTMGHAMRIYDITRPVSATFPVYPGDPAIEVTPVAQLAWGDV